MNARFTARMPPARPRRRVDLSGRRRALRASPWRARLGWGLLGAALALGPLLWLDRLPPAPARESAVQVDAPAAPPAVDLVTRLPAAPSATPAPGPPPPATADDLVPVVHLKRGGTLWGLARARVGRDLLSILRWIGEVQILNNISDPDRVEPGPLVVPAPDRRDPVFMRRGDLPHSP